MLNLIWPYTITADNNRIRISHGSSTHNCYFPIGTYYGLTFGTGSMLGSDSLMYALRMALVSHPTIAPSDIQALFTFGEEALVTTKMTPKQYLLVDTSDSIHLDWTDSFTTADPSIFGFTNASTWFNSVSGVVCISPDRGNVSHHFTPNFGCDNVDLSYNLKVHGSQVHAASNSGADSYYTRVLGETYQGNLVYDVVPAGYVKTYLNTIPNSAFSNQSYREIDDEENTVEQVLRAASENATFSVLIDKEVHSLMKINHPWDMETVATAFGGSGHYYTITFSINKVT